MSTEYAIRIEGLSKQYRLGRRQESYVTLRDTVSEVGRSLVRMVSRRSRRTDRDSRLFWALKGVSFQVEPGEVVGLVGRNGAGKTTLLKLLSRVTEPTEGRARIQGRIGALLEVGTGFHPELTGRENVFLSGAIFGMKRSEIRRKFDEIVAFAEMDRFIDTPVKFFSTGMHVRLAFSVAAHLEPDILLVDEVLSVGDVSFQKKCLAKMEDVAHGGRTVLFVSHHMFSLQNFCTRGILLEGGRVALDADIATVIKQYLSAGGKQTGVEEWPSPDRAPGNDRLRLKAVRTVSEGVVTGLPDLAQPLRIEVDYWNLVPDAQLVVSFHLITAMGVCVFTSANFPSASIEADPWYGRDHPTGLYRTSCTIPPSFLNDGTYTVSVYFSGNLVTDGIFAKKAVLAFTMQDRVNRDDYTGAWDGVVRPRLAWATEQLHD